MTEISNESPYYGQPEKTQESSADPYHWVTPDTKTAGVSKTAQSVGRAEVAGYDCTAPKGGPK